MSEATVAAAIESRFKTLFVGSEKKVFEGVGFKPDGTDYIRLSVLFADENQVTIAAQPRYRTFGVIAMQCFSLNKGTGLGTLRQMKDRAKAVYRGAKFSGITCREISDAQAGPDGDYIQWNVNVEFFFEST